jgi:hypothetical protein
VRAALAAPMSELAPARPATRNPGQAAAEGEGTEILRTTRPNKPPQPISWSVPRMPLRPRNVMEILPAGFQRQFADWSIGPATAHYFQTLGTGGPQMGPHWEELKKTTRFEAVRLPMIGPHFELIGELGETMRYFVPKNKQAHLDPMARLFKAICGPSRARTNDIFISSQIRGAQQIAVAEASGYAQRVNIGEQFAELAARVLETRTCAGADVRGFAYVAYSAIALALGRTAGPSLNPPMRCPLQSSSGSTWERGKGKRWSPPKESSGTPLTCQAARSGRS